MRQDMPWRESREAERLTFDDLVRVHGDVSLFVEDERRSRRRKDLGQGQHGMNVYHYSSTYSPLYTIKVSIPSLERIDPFHDRSGSRSGTLHGSLSWLTTRREDPTRTIDLANTSCTGHSFDAGQVETVDTAVTEASAALLELRWS